MPAGDTGRQAARSEEHTSELQSRSDLVCRLLLEKKKQNPKNLASSAETRLTNNAGTLREPMRRATPCVDALADEWNHTRSCGRKTTHSPQPKPVGSVD